MAPDFTSDIMFQADAEQPQAKKIELVAKAVREALLARPEGQGHFLRPVLTSFAVVADLEAALAVVKEVKERQLTADGKTKLLLCS